MAIVVVIELVVVLIESVNLILVNSPTHKRDVSDRLKIQWSSLDVHDIHGNIVKRLLKHAIFITTIMDTSGDARMGDSSNDNTASPMTISLGEMLHRTAIAPVNCRRPRDGCLNARRQHRCNELSHFGFPSASKPWPEEQWETRVETHRAVAVRATFRISKSHALA